MRRILVLAPLLALSAVSLCNAQNTPATAPARTADFGTPEAATRTFIAALRANDYAAARAAMTTSTDLGMQFTDAFTDITVTTRHLSTACHEHFTDPPNLPDVADQFETAFAGATVETDGDTAWLVPKGQPRDAGLAFRKVGNAWKMDTEKCYKLDTPDGKKAAEDLTKSAPTTTLFLKSAIKDIEGGKIKTLAELRQRMAGAPK